MAGDNSSSVFLTEDIITSILLRLPIASCIARFRCVCRSWRVLLSDPQFILRILCFPNNSDYDGDHLKKSSLQILITGGGDAATPEELRRCHYSLLSYDTLRPISAGDLPGKRQSFNCYSLIVAGCCDGIFCIVDIQPGGAPGVILWNPTTSETKILPVSAGPPPRRSLPGHQQITGFGFDPQTNDYKVARILCFEPEFNDCNEYDLDWEERLSTVTYAEVYSLRNDSWKRLNINDELIPSLEDPVHNVHPQQQQRGNHNSQKQSICHWFYGSSGVCFTLSFDMTEEVFESTVLSPPPVIDVDSLTTCTGCFMLKDSFVVPFSSYDNNTAHEIWGLLKPGVADSWTKLYLLTPPVWHMQWLEIWKDGRFICSRESGRWWISNPKDREETDGVYILSPATTYQYSARIEIQGRTPPFQAYTFTPTHTSLSC